MLSLQAHRTTTRHLQSLYLAQAGSGLPCDGPVLGIDALSGRSFSFDPFGLYPAVLTNPNLLVLGQVGAGKSTLAKLVCWSQAALCGRAVAILDPKGEYGELAATLGMTQVRLVPGGRTRLNPLELAAKSCRPQDLRRRRADVVGALAESGLGRALNSEERAGIDLATCVLDERALLGDVVGALLEPSSTMAEELRTSSKELGLACRGVALELRRLVAGDLAGMFDAPSTVTLDPRGPGVLVDLSAVYGSPHVLAPTMVAAGSWIREAVARPGRQHVLVLDETWQVLGDPGVAGWLRSTMKLSRALGVAVVLVTHHLSDFDTVGTSGSEAARLAKALVDDTATHAILAQPAAALADTKAVLGLSQSETELLAHLGRGRALWHVGDHVGLVRHLVPAELSSVVDTDVEMRAA